MNNNKKNRKEVKIKIGPPRLTRYELARVIGARALQISMGAPVLVDVPKGMTDPIDIALYELKMGVLPIVIRRRRPDGTYQDIPVQELLRNTELKEY
ncbi:MAG: DNA-directed RNA polymerase subunit K [Thermoprotei archaeon]|nr:DNA-directed RNA polymerase subunit K [Thermoprotei archaeon]